MSVKRIATVHLPRVAAIGALAATATAGATWAAAQGVPATPPTPAAATTAKAPPLVVPDVRDLAFVFAKGTLQDAGFAWRVRGSVHGFPANTVVSQSPVAGTKVADTGAPVVTVTLRRTPGYPPAGEPQDSSPYPGTAVEPVGLSSS